MIVNGWLNKMKDNDIRNYCWMIAQILDIEDYHERYSTMEQLFSEYEIELIDKFSKGVE